MPVFAFMCTESFRHQYLRMLEVMSTSQYRDQILVEIQQQSVSLNFKIIYHVYGQLFASCVVCEWISLSHFLSRYHVIALD